MKDIIMMYYNKNITILDQLYKDAEYIKNYEYKHPQIESLVYELENLKKKLIAQRNQIDQFVL